MNRLYAIIYFFVASAFFALAMPSTVYAEEVLNQKSEETQTAEEKWASRRNRGYQSWVRGTNDYEASSLTAPELHSDEYQRYVKNDDPNPLEALLSNLVVSIGVALTGAFKTTLGGHGVVDLSTMGIIMGKWSNNGLNPFIFDLTDRNIYGKIASVIYGLIRGIALNIAFLMMMVAVVKTLLRNGSGQEIALVKDRLWSFIVFVTLLYAMPLIVDYACETRDTATVVFYKGLDKMIEGGVDVDDGVPADAEIVDLAHIVLWAADKINGRNGTLGGIEQKYYDEWQRVPNFVNALVFLLMTTIPLFYMTSYIRIALQETMLFGLFPLFAVVGQKQKGVFYQWCSIFFTNLFVPALDIILVTMPAYIVKILGLDGGTMLTAIIIFTMRGAVIPIRNQVLRIFGNFVGVSGGMGLGGSLALAASAARMLKQVSNRQESGSANSSQNSSKPLPDEADKPTSLNTQMKPVEEHREGAPKNTEVVGLTAANKNIPTISEDQMESQKTGDSVSGGNDTTTGKEKSQIWENNAGNAGEEAVKQDGSLSGDDIFVQAQSGEAPTETLDPATLDKKADEQEQTKNFFDNPQTESEDLWNQLVWNDHSQRSQMESAGLKYESSTKESEEQIPQERETDIRAGKLQDRATVEIEEGSDTVSSVTSMTATSESLDDRSLESIGSDELSRENQMAAADEVQELTVTPEALEKIAPISEKGGQPETSQNISETSEDRKKAAPPAVVKLAESVRSATAGKGVEEYRYTMRRAANLATIDNLKGRQTAVLSGLQGYGTILDNYKMEQKRLAEKHGPLETRSALASAEYAKQDRELRKLDSAREKARQTYMVIPYGTPEKEKAEAAWHSADDRYLKQHAITTTAHDAADRASSALRANEDRQRDLRTAIADTQNSITNFETRERVIREELVARQQSEQHYAQIQSARTGAPEPMYTGADEYTRAFIRNANIERVARYKDMQDRPYDGILTERQKMDYQRAQKRYEVIEMMNGQRREDKLNRIGEDIKKQLDQIEEERRREQAIDRLEADRKKDDDVMRRREKSKKDNETVDNRKREADGKGQRNSEATA